MLFPCFGTWAQNVTISGQISDKETKETLPYVTVICDSLVTVTDEDGNYTFSVAPNATHTIKIDFPDYTEVQMPVKVGTLDVAQDIQMETVSSTSLDEAVVVAEIGKLRETPIAISNIDAKKIQEELGPRDLPMILNTTPGVYASEGGGGVGDSRISMRGFNGENVAVMVDGVPVNDMENGSVFWSNWDGLGDITRQMQVQRGLGASKLSTVAVGGTVNIITKGIDQKMSGYLRQEVSTTGLYKTSFGYNSGQLKGHWGISVAGSRKSGKGYADATFDDAWSYFLKIQKRFNKHLISFSVNGAPQSHGQRSTQVPLAVYSEHLAKKVGIDPTQQIQDVISTGSSSQRYTTPTQGERGTMYNPDWGYMNGKIVNTSVNFYHKPLANITHSWTPNNRLNLTTVAYASLGSGGGTALFKPTSATRDSTNGQINLDKTYTDNSSSSAILPYYSTTEHSSTNWLKTSWNNHQWYGLISTLNYHITENIQALGGIDLRYYQGHHFQTIDNLLGADYALYQKANVSNPNSGDWNQPNGINNLSYAMKRVGDTVGTNYFVQNKWGGAFLQFEYKKHNWSAFITGSANYQGMRRFDEFKKRDLVLADTTLRQAVGYGDTVTYEGVKYTNTSPEAKVATSDWKWFLGWTTKMGANYKIDDHQNVFVNAGYLSIPKRVQYVFTTSLGEYQNVKNQVIESLELGYGYKTGKVSLSVNGYYTAWKDQPQTTSFTSTDGSQVYVNINGIDELHKGIEMEFTYRPFKKLTLEAFGALCDWTYTSGSTAYLYDNGGNLIDSVSFSAKGVHVGNNPQDQLGGAVRFDVVKNGYIKVRGTFFSKYYQSFNPLTLSGDYRNHESWKLPNYFMLDINFGYDIYFKKSRFKLNINGGVFNALNQVYITDATNNTNFNATNALVYVGAGTRGTLGLKLYF